MLSDQFEEVKKVVIIRTSFVVSLYPNKEDPELKGTLER